MSTAFPEIRSGQIVWAMVRDERGYRKRRPVIILTPDDEISHVEPLVLMAVTTTYTDPAPPNCVELPWNSDPRRVATGLARRSAAVVNWLVTAYADEIDGVIGAVPSNVMLEIRRRLAALERHGE